MFKYYNQQKFMFEFFEIKNVFFDFFFHFHRDGMLRLVSRSLAKTLIRKERAEIELPMQHYDEMEEQERNAWSNFDFNLFLAD